MLVKKLILERLLTIAALLATVSCASAQQGQSSAEEEQRARSLLAVSNPIEPSPSLWIEELTYIEVRDRIAAGVTTAIIATGGIEENGPFLATGKHNLIIKALCPAIAASLGDALCAPIVPFVPQGDLNPPTGAMYFPGSFTVRDETFRALLDDIASSLKLHGFTDIVLIGDNGGNQVGMQIVADGLNERWADTGVRAHFVSEFYSPGWEATEAYTENVLGVSESKHDGHHDDIWVTAMMMVTEPDSVRYQQRLDANLASINGVDISSLEDTVALGAKMVEFRADYTANAIRDSIASQ